MHWKKKSPTTKLKKCVTTDRRFLKKLNVTPRMSQNMIWGNRNLQWFTHSHHKHRHFSSTTIKRQVFNFSTLNQVRVVWVCLWAPPALCDSSLRLLHSSCCQNQSTVGRTQTHNTTTVLSHNASGKWDNSCRPCKEWNNAVYWRQSLSEHAACSGSGSIPCFGGIMVKTVKTRHRSTRQCMCLGTGEKTHTWKLKLTSG